MATGGIISHIQKLSQSLKVTLVCTGTERKHAGIINCPVCTPQQASQVAQFALAGLQMYRNPQKIMSARKTQGIEITQQPHT